MTGIFDAIVDGFRAIFFPIEFFVRALIFLFRAIIVFVDAVISILSIFPTQLMACSVALLVICVIYKIFGRENQS